MNKKEIRCAFDVVINAAEQMKCEDLHHTTKQQHKADEVCLAQYHVHSQADIVREYMESLK